MRRRKKSEPTCKLLRHFCRIMLPDNVGDEKPLGVIERVKRLKVDARTYYLWNAGEVAPHFETFVDMLYERGYELKIVPRKDTYQ